MDRSRKILIIVENQPVPLDVRVWKEARSLHAAGYQVTVLCPRARGYEKNYEFIDNIHIYRHPAPKEGDSNIGYIVEYSSALLWEFAYSCWIYLRRGFHVIQGCNPPDDIVFVALPFKALGVKYIFDHHDVNPELYLSKYARRGVLYNILVWLEKITYRFSDVVLATNESYREIAIDRGGQQPENVFVVRNGPSIGTFKPRSPKQQLKCGKQHLIGYVGVMNVQEGIDILLDVALHIKRLGRDDVHFTCIGRGPSVARLRAMTHEKGLDDTVSFTGHVPFEELIEILSTADVCVNPDKPCEMNNISTMNKIMEYMALGKPIVQFDLKEGRFSAGEASLYADRNDQVSDFAGKILWLLDHPQERQRMGEIGRQRVERELAWEYSVQNLLSAYEKVFARKSQPSLGVLSTFRLK